LDRVSSIFRKNLNNLLFFCKFCFVKGSCYNPFYQRYKAKTHDCCNGINSLATTCGISAITNGRIVGGSVTPSKGVWPWMVSTV